MSRNKRPHDMPDGGTPIASPAPKKRKVEKDEKPNDILAPTSTPSSVMGIAHVARLVPIQDCRHVLQSLLSDREARLLVSKLSSSSSPSSSRKGRFRRATQYLSSKYDELYPAKQDQVMAFDGVVSTITKSLRQIWKWGDDSYHSSSSSSSAMMGKPHSSSHGQRMKFKPPPPPTMEEVSTNVRAIHAAAVFPASLGTRLNALRALLEINQFLIRSSFLKDPDDRKEIVQSFPTPGTAVLEIVRSLSVQERIIALGVHFPSDQARIGGGGGGGGGSGGGQKMIMMVAGAAAEPGAGQVNHGYSQGQTNGINNNNSQGEATKGVVVGTAAGETLEVELKAQARIFHKIGIFKGVVDAYEALMESKRGMGAVMQAVPINISDGESDESEFLECEQEKTEQGGEIRGGGEVPESQ